MTALRLAAVFGDHMVLCRRKEIRLFGVAEDSRVIHAELNGYTAETIARNGAFLLLLPQMEAGGPYTLTVTDGEETLTFADVLVGDVYLAGGQSNMELELQNADHGMETAAKADNNQIRFYNTPKQPYWCEAAEQAEREACWKAVAPGVCADVSAVAFCFVERMQAQLGVPVGIVDCYWGGTSAACWMDEDTLRRTAEGQQCLNEYAAQALDDVQYDRENSIFERDLQRWNDAVARFKGAHHGAAWEDVLAYCGPCPWSPPAGRKSAFRPAGLVETMLKRVAPYTLTAILYYQGESDDPHPERYQALLTSLIALWRRLFCEETLPFSFVQLPMYAEIGKAEDFSWPMLRLAQERVLQTVRHTAMTVLLDCGEYNNVHPTDKETVGERLFLQTLKLVYHIDLRGDSPRAISKHVKGGSLIVRFDTPIHCTAQAPSLLEIADESGVFAQAEAILRDGELWLTEQSVPYPTQARYAWIGYAKVDLFGENGLPLAPFWLR